MSLTIKAFLQQDDCSEPEIRRFQVPIDVSSSFDNLSKNLCDIFPALTSGNFSVFWKDPDEDHVTISTDGELLEALGFVTDGVFKICLVLKDDAGSTDNDVIHPSVMCNGCETPIGGLRYKCLVCPDYALCKSCEGKGTHVEHDLMKVTTPSSSPGFLSEGSSGPRGTGQHGPFVPPPHFRRWLQKFMKRWHNQHVHDCGKKADKGDKGEEMGHNSGDDDGQDMNQSSAESMKDVTETAASMFDPLGIDDEYHVETNTNSDDKGNTTDGKESSEKPGCQGRKSNGRGRGGKSPHRQPRCPQGPSGGMRMGQPNQGQTQCGKGKGQGCGKKAGKKPDQDKPTDISSKKEDEEPKRSESSIQIVHDADTDSQTKSRSDISRTTFNINKKNEGSNNQVPDQTQSGS